MAHDTLQFYLEIYRTLVDTVHYYDRMFPGKRKKNRAETTFALLFGATDALLMLLRDDD